MKPANAQGDKRRGVMKSGSSVLTRALLVLRAFTDGKPEWGVRELGRELRIHPTAVYRILRVLTAEGFLQYEEGQRRYRVGAELYRLSAIVQQTSPLTHVVGPFMRELASEYGETILFAIWDARLLAMSFVAQVESQKAVRYVITLGTPRPLHAGSTGRAILAFLEPEVVNAVLAKPLERFTHRTPVEPAIIRQLLARVRRLGYSFSRGEVIEGAAGIAAPLWDFQGIVGSLNLTMPEARYKAGMEKIVGPKVQAVAMRLSSILGRKVTS